MWILKVSTQVKLVLQVCAICLWYWSVESYRYGSYKLVDNALLQTLSQAYIQHSQTCISRLCCSVACRKEGCVLFKFSEGKCITYTSGEGASSNLTHNDTKYYGLREYLDEQSKVCPSGFLKFESMCYIFKQNLTDWFTAQAECNKHGGRLVSILKESIQNFIYSNAINEKHWIGSRKINNVWIWTHENVSITDVTPGGIFLSGDGSCLEVAGNNWNDLSCTGHSRKSVCVL